MPVNFNAYKRRREKLLKANKSMCPCCDCPKNECECPKDCKTCSCHKKTSKSFKDFYRDYEDQ